MLLLLIGSGTLGFKYYSFYLLKKQNIPQIQAQVLLHYHKTNPKGQTYSVLKLKSDFGVFYTTSKEDLKNIQNAKVKLNVVFKKVNFYEYLKGFYAPSFNLILLPTSKNYLRDFVLKAHQEKIMGEFYATFFLADSLPKAWRDLAQSYGISHLFAISGFHIGILSGVLFFVFGFFYTPLQKRFFPFRNRHYDIGFLVVLVLFSYYFVLGESPSYLRALTMALIAFFLFFRGVDLLRIEMLFWSVLVLLACFPQLIFSIGFYFSSLGVLYIFIFMRFFKVPKTFKSKIKYGILLNLYVFFLMGIIVYYFFPYFSPLSLYGIFITLIFAFCGFRRCI
ncbi:ComEC/Rec2 family competence protein [Helicobacter burdigaliensis]|uniref:ComEC/Rec2 family competence protein n=1 Tax=Helicobacter burdigaliensis TaxID=2315334 RepID=UPI001E3800B3|nr:ComEC/Rec2 family competence protein [Helicobacter burdigaliensis]